MNRFTLRCLVAGLLSALLVVSAGTAQAGTYYWDTKRCRRVRRHHRRLEWHQRLLEHGHYGAAAGTFIASPTVADDLFINGGTTGTITLTGAQVASSLTFAVNVAATLSGGTSLTIGGSGTNSGIFVASGDNAANTVSSPLILNSTSTALNFSNAGTGLLTIGAVTGARLRNPNDYGRLVEHRRHHAQRDHRQRRGRRNVALAINNTSTGVTTLSGANTFTGGLTIKSGTVSGTTSVNAFGAMPAQSRSRQHRQRQRHPQRRVEQHLRQPISVAGGNTA